MIRLSALLVSFIISGHALAYTTYSRTTNPLNGNYGVSRSPVVVQNSSTGLSNILPQSSFGSVQTNPRASTIQTTVTTSQVSAPQVQTGHSHPVPQFAPPPVTQHPYAHAHGPRVPPPPAPAPGFPHMHSGHPYVAPAVAPQRMTYQQIIEYLANTNGSNLTSVLRNGSGNTLVQCKAYCDTLPPSPVCDASNILYRNECEAKCLNKTVMTSNLRYGICCCSDQDYTYDTDGNLFFAQNTSVNLCISTCIFNCLGGETPIEAQHASDTNPVELARSSDRCPNIG